MRTHVLFAATCLAMCLPLGASAQSAPGYPVQVRDFAHWDSFPAQCAGYRRGDVVAYAPALADYSIGYNLGSQHTAVTLFFYPRHGEIPAQVRDEEAEVLGAHPDSRVVSHRVVALERDGKPFKAAVITFEFNSVPPSSGEPLSSELWLVFLPSKTFKVRSTGPVRRAAQSDAEVRQILECVAWSG